MKFEIKMRHEAGNGLMPKEKLRFDLLSKYAAFLCYAED